MRLIVLTFADCRRKIHRRGEEVPWSRENRESTLEKRLNLLGRIRGNFVKSQPGQNVFAYE